MVRLTASMFRMKFHFHKGASMTYTLKDFFRVTAFNVFGKAEAYFDTPSFPEDHELINFLLDNPNCRLKIERIYDLAEHED